MKDRFFPGALPLLAICVLMMLAACAGDQAGDPAAAERARVDIVRDCQDKPYYDKTSMSDGKTIVRGMTPVEREVCLMNSPSLKGGMMGM